jgi:hypothetical protein
MKKKPLTLKELKKTWWWRRRDHRNPRKGFKPREFDRNQTDRVIERVAHNYELMRRCPKAKGFPNTYLELDRETKTIAYTLWATLPGSAYRFAFVPQMHKERGWTDTDPKIQWNLRLPDGTLTAQFIKYINLWRRFQNVRHKHSVNGQINAKISWREIEILDRKQNRIGVLDSSERHTAGVALEKAAQFLVEFKQARSKHLKQPKTSFESLFNMDNQFEPHF